MASRTVVELTDDLDGKSPAEETVRFALDGRELEIDLSEKNAKALRKALDPYIEAGRRVGGRRSRPTEVATAVDYTAVRAWAKSNGYPVSPRGRISAEIVGAFRAAGN